MRQWKHMFWYHIKIKHRSWITFITLCHFCGKRNGDVCLKYNIDRKHNPSQTLTCFILYFFSFLHLSQINIYTISERLSQWTEPIIFDNIKPLLIAVTTILRMARSSQMSATMMISAGMSQKRATHQIASKLRYIYKYSYKIHICTFSDTSLEEGALGKQWCNEESEEPASEEPVAKEADSAARYIGWVFFL